jgi:hypothetical protein
VGDFVAPAVDGQMPDGAVLAGAQRDLALELARVLAGPARFPENMDPRMVPSVAAKEQHRPFGN